MPHRIHSMPFGAEPCSAGVRFRIWALGQESLSVVIGDADPQAMNARGDGWHELITATAQPGTRYRFALSGGLLVPDPASRYQPDDASGASEVIDPRSYRWLHPQWRGRAWEEAVLYELHVGAFTPAGTFRAAIDKLDHLAELGVTGIELMPVADFPGRWNWGYDGVLPFAPDSTYGRPEDLKALVDAAHARNLMVLLDVVYNHFGPVGNFLQAYAPQFFTSRHKTPWGDAVNYDGSHSECVRSFAIHNALYWIQEYCLDGLRLDAVHAIVDDSPRHLLEELAERVHGLADQEERQVHLVLENEANGARFLTRRDARRPRWYSAQWNDDLHHGLHVAATRETAGYYEDYADATQMIGRALAEGFAYQGEPSRHQNGRTRGEPSGHLPPTAFIDFLQNHDQVGNRAFGERLTQIASAEAVRACAAVYLLAPSIPMLFMGEEWSAGSPFPYFCDLPELAAAIREGRRKEFAKFPEFQTPQARERIPDPNDAGTFAMARLDWSELTRSAHGEWLAWYHTLLSKRRAVVIPLLRAAPVRSARFFRVGDCGVSVSWQFESGDELHLQANLGGASLRGFATTRGTAFMTEGAGACERIRHGELGPWSVVWSVFDAGAADT